MCSDDWGRSCCPPCSVEAHINCRNKVFKVVRSVVPHAIYEKRRCTVDTAADSSEKIAANTGPKLVSLQRLLQIRDGQSVVIRKLEHKSQAQTLLVFVEAVVHLPETFMGAGEFGRFR